MYKSCGWCSVYKEGLFTSSCIPNQTVHFCSNNCKTNFETGYAEECEKRERINTLYNMIPKSIRDAYHNYYTSQQSPLIQEMIKEMDDKPKSN